MFKKVSGKFVSYTQMLDYLKLKIFWMLMMHIFMFIDSLLCYAALLSSQFYILFCSAILPRLENWTVWGPHKKRQWRRWNLWRRNVRVWSRSATRTSRPWPSIAKCCRNRSGKTRNFRTGWRNLCKSSQTSKGKLKLKRQVRTQRQVKSDFKRQVRTQKGSQVRLQRQVNSVVNWQRKSDFKSRVRL